jgi:electron transfer flavoprotein beta subunit
VLCGRQAIDGDTAQVGPQTAEKLGINQITCVSNIENLDTSKKEITAIRSIEGGWEKVKAKLPVLVTFTEEGEIPRPASAIKTMTFKRAAPVVGDDGPIALWDIAAINADPVQCGLSGSPTKVKKIDSVVLTAADIKYIDPSEAGITELIHGLIADHTFG